MTVSLPMSARKIALVFAALCMVQFALAQTRSAPGGGMAIAPSAPLGDTPTLSVVEWLQRMHSASRQRSYVGTFVVSAATGDLSSARIWHVCEGDLQMERVEALSGPPRSTFRRNDRVMTFLPDAKVVKSEKRDSLELFPNLLGTPDSALNDFYSVRVLGKGRVAGFDADVVNLVPRDMLRFGYRIWSERRSGLVVKLQTLDGEGRVVEQSAFSELQLDAPVKVQALSQMMADTTGYRIEKSELDRTTPQAEGWTLKNPVDGFKPASCYRRTLGGAGSGEHAMQWTFTDGLATVSLFVEPYDAQRQPKEVLLALGATHTMTRRLVDPSGDWWLTAVGEVPPQTLEAFALRLARTR
ncbi:MucB/RseB C-terminal domain-containing protein [Variovorax sp. PAMC 28711]|uniref:MucB/RseB C-terminal domain-containing protein n=1 Tax=Variovorax sp. PAMC 28711 TaxID=1795631 RepID=UPI00078EA87C|nr:MucB/RseB C-terminal domain-containing protein [Variovorax sp. PAMC 28711]AMM25541.1 transcriptional regulator [Variovorax sp. PAMC 28711]